MKVNKESVVGFAMYSIQPVYLCTKIQDVSRKFEGGI